MISLRDINPKANQTNHLVLLHAFPFSSVMWDEAASIIKSHASQFSIILVDFPGFGSAPYLHQWTLKEAVIDLHSQLQSLGIEKAVIGGISMGGYAAFAYYSLFRDSVTGLILSNTKAAADSLDAKKNREEFALAVETDGYEAVYEKLLPKLVSDNAFENNSDLLLSLKNQIEGSETRSIAACSRTLALREDSSELLPIISCPTLVITSDADKIIPAKEMQELSTKIPGSIFKSLPEVGHLSVIEDPRTWSEFVVSFLNDIQ
ncbi:MAG: alpha/beta hydrolase [bacterium]